MKNDHLSHDEARELEKYGYAVSRGPTQKAMTLSVQPLDDEAKTTKSGFHQTLHAVTRILPMATRSDVDRGVVDGGSQDTMTKRDERTFWTGSKYDGEWNTLGMCGKGVYTMPHCVVYEGGMYDGMFHGAGVLRYPDGSRISGEWNHGKMKSSKYVFPDGLEFEPEDWKYCTEEDRRFWRCIQTGLRPAGRCYKTNRQPTRGIPENCYDNEEGFYDPKTKCLLDPEDESMKTVLRVPTDKEVSWIERHCRRSWQESTGHQKELYRDWQDLDKDLGVLDAEEKDVIAAADDNRSDTSGNSSGEMSKSSWASLGSHVLQAGGYRGLIGPEDDDAGDTDMIVGQDGKRLPAMVAQGGILNLRKIGHVSIQLDRHMSPLHRVSSGESFDSVDDGNEADTEDTTDDGSRSSMSEEDE